jgi:hypothetical protein
MNTTKTPEQLYTSRELAEYSAQAVKSEKRQQRAGRESWTNPFSIWDTVRVEYRAKVGRTGFRLAWFDAYLEAEDIARELATNDPVIAKMIARMDSGGPSALRQRIAFNRWITNSHSVPKITDGQRSRVYRAEDKVRETPFATRDEAVQFLFSVTQSDWWAQHSGFGVETPRLLHTNGNRASAWAEPHVRKVKLAGSWSWRRSVVLHELAHLLGPVDEHHGPIFVALHIMLVERFMSSTSAAELRQSYLAGHVKIATQTTLRALFDTRKANGYKATTAASLKAAKALRFDYVPKPRAKALASR